MKVYKIIEMFLLGCIDLFWRIFISIHERKNIKKKANLFKNVELTEEQKKQIDDLLKQKEEGDDVKGYYQHLAKRLATMKWNYREMIIEP